MQGVPLPHEYTEYPHRIHATSCVYSASGQSDDCVVCHGFHGQRHASQDLPSAWVSPRVLAALPAASAPCHAPQALPATEGKRDALGRAPRCPPIQRRRPGVACSHRRPGARCANAGAQQRRHFPWFFPDFLPTHTPSKARTGTGSPRPGIQMTAVGDGEAHADVVGFLRVAGHPSTTPLSCPATPRSCCPAVRPVSASCPTPAPARQRSTPPVRGGSGPLLINSYG